MSCVRSVSVCSPSFCLPPRPFPLLPHPTKSPRPHPLLSHSTNSSHPISSFSSTTPSHLSPVAWYHSPSDDIWKPENSRKSPDPSPIYLHFLLHRLHLYIVHLLQPDISARTSSPPNFVSSPKRLMTISS